MIFKIGHRGACGYEPENTLRSFKKALSFNLDAIELDLRKCKTGELIIMHDETLDRTTNGKGFVKDKTLKELRKLDAGDGEKIPIFEEVLDLINKKSKVVIEIKEKNTSQDIIKILNHYIKNKDWDYDDFLAISFNKKELKQFKKLIPNIKTVLLRKIPLFSVMYARYVNSEAVGLYFKFINKKRLDRFHKKNLKLFAWLVDYPTDLEKMKKLKVDGIVSDYPDRI